MWFDEAVVYQIYPLGLCGVLNEERSSDDSVVGHSILEVKDWISHIKKLGATCVLLILSWKVTIMDMTPEITTPWIAVLARTMT